MQASEGERGSGGVSAAPVAGMPFPSISRAVVTVAVVVVLGVVLLVALELPPPLLHVVALVGLGLGATGAVSIRFLRQAHRGAARAERAAVRERCL